MKANASKLIPATDGFRIIGCGRGSGYDLILKERLPAEKIGGRWYVSQAAAEKLARERARLTDAAGAPSAA